MESAQPVSATSLFYIKLHKMGYFNSVTNTTLPFLPEEPYVEVCFPANMT